MFKISGGKGFHITFPNGYTVSVQFGPANYCQHYDRPIAESELRACGKEGSVDAEIGVWNRAGEWEHGFPEGYRDAARVLEVLNIYAAKEPRQ